MALYVTNDLAFDLEDEGFVDLTTQDLEAPLHGGHKLGLLIAREPMLPGSTLADAVTAHVEDDRRRLRFHRVLERHEQRVAGRAAIEVIARWAHRGLELHAREVHLCASGTRLTFSVTAPLEHREAADACFDRMISTLDLDQREEP